MFAGAGQPQNFTLYPAVDIYRGAAVKLVQGRRGSGTTVGDDPVALARHWAARGAKALHVVDLSAAFGEGEETAKIRDILRAAPIPVNVGGGVRSTEQVDALLDAGAHRVVLGTRAITDSEWLAAVAARHPGRIVAAADAAGDRIRVQGWERDAGLTVLEFFDRVRELPLAGLLYTNIDVEGRGQGMEWTAVEIVLREAPHPVLVSGGVAGLKDLRRLKILGAAGAVVGRALYDGSLDFESAVKELEP